MDYNQFYKKKYFLKTSVLILIFYQAFIAAAEEVKIGIGISVPPYVIIENNSGIQLEIHEKAFSASGHRIIPVFSSRRRVYHEFNAKNIDTMINVKEGVVMGYYSDIVIVYHNVIISLAKNNFPDFRNISFLSDKSVLAFQKANFLLGDDFRKMALQNKHYEEVDRQILQVYRLFKNRIDFIVSDINIFNYYRRMAKNTGPMTPDELSQKVKFHMVFKPSPYRSVFHSRNLCDDFNRGLEVIRRNGTYDQIMEKYQFISEAD